MLNATKKPQHVNIFRNRLYFYNNSHIPDFVHDILITKRWVGPLFMANQTSYLYGKSKNTAKMKRLRDKNTEQINTRTLSTEKYKDK